MLMADEVDGSSSGLVICIVLTFLSWLCGHGGLTVLGTNCLPPNQYVEATGAPTVAEFGNREVIKGK